MHRLRWRPVCATTHHSKPPHTLTPRAAHRGVHGRACDVRDESAVDALADFAVQRMGGLDLWINNAGCSQARKAPLVDTPADTIKVCTAAVQFTLGCTVSGSGSRL